MKRHQKSYRVSDSHLQNTLNTQKNALVGTLAYNHENQRKVLVKWIVMDELSFSLYKFFNFEEYVQLALQPAYKRISMYKFRKVVMTNFLAMK